MSAAVTPASVATTLPAAAVAETGALTSTSPAATATPTPPQAEIVAAGLNVREGPGMAYTVSGTVAQGDRLTISLSPIVPASGKSG